MIESKHYAEKVITGNPSNHYRMKRVCNHQKHKDAIKSWV